MVGGTKGPNLRGPPMPTTLDSAPESLEDLLLPILEKLERKEFDLPPLPQVANQVLALTTDPTAQSDKLAVLIQPTGHRSHCQNPADSQFRGPRFPEED